MNPLCQHTPSSPQGWRTFRAKKQQRLQNHAESQPQPQLWELWWQSLTWQHSVLQSLSSKGRWWLRHSGGSGQTAGWPAMARPQGRPAGAQRPCWSSPLSHNLRTKGLWESEVLHLHVSEFRSYQPCHVCLFPSTMEPVGTVGTCGNQSAKKYIWWTQRQCLFPEMMTQLLEIWHRFCGMWATIFLYTKLDCITVQKELCIYSVWDGVGLKAYRKLMCKRLGILQQNQNNKKHYK